MATISVRPATADDRAYILDNFGKSYRHSGYANGTSTEILKQQLDPLLATWTTTIASPVDDPSVILAWLLYRDSKTVAWCHVRPGLRRKGIAKQLLQHAGIAKGEIMAPFLPTKLEGTPGSFSNIAKDHGYTLRFRPYLPLQVGLELARTLAAVLA